MILSFGKKPSLDSKSPEPSLGEPSGSCWPFRVLITLLFPLWTYLFFVTVPLVVHDAGTYLREGEIIFRDGFLAFLRTGPHHEPLFPLILAFSMALGKACHISYFFFVKFFGLLCLGSAVLLSHLIMVRLRISPYISALVLFFLGSCPPLLFSALKPWAEYAAYPFLLLSVLGLVRILQGIREGAPEKFWPLLRVSSLFILSMFMATMAKAISEAVVWIFLVFGGIWALFLLLGKRREVAGRMLKILCLVFLLYGGLLNGYKGSNFLLNKQFSLTSRSEYFYGHAHQAMAPLSREKVLALFLRVVPFDACARLVSSEACEYWSFVTADGITGSRRLELLEQGYSGGDVKERMMREAFLKYASNIPQAVFVSGLKMVAIFFWHGSVTFVALPQWVEAIVHRFSFLYVMNIAAALISFLGLIGGIVYLIPSSFLASNRPDDVVRRDIVGSLLFVMFSFLAPYGLFNIADRYVFPVAPFFFVLFAFVVQAALERMRAKKTH